MLIVGGAALILGLLADAAAADCPAPADVMAQGRVLTGRDSQALTSGRVQITGTSDGVGVRLLAPDGSTLAERRLPPALTCAQRAEAAAVIIAMWEAQLLPGTVLPLQTAAPPSAAPSLHVPAMLPPTPARVGASISLGVGGVLSPTRLSSGATLITNVTPFDRVGFFAAASGRWRERTPVGSGQVSSQTFVLAAGASYRWAAPGGHQFDVHAGPAAALLVARGEKFAMNRDPNGFSPALIAGTRWTRRGGEVQPWLGATVTGYGSRRITVENTVGNQERLLGSWDIQLAAVSARLGGRRGGRYGFKLAKRARHAGTQRGRSHGLPHS